MSYLVINHVTRHSRNGVKHVKMIVEKIYVKITLQIMSKLDNSLIILTYIYTSN